MVQGTQEYYLAQVTALQLELEKAHQEMQKIQVELVLGLDSLQALVRESQTEKAKAQLQVLALEKELVSVRSELILAKAREWEFQKESGRYLGQSPQG